MGPNFDACGARFKASNSSYPDYKVSTMDRVQICSLMQEGPNWSPTKVAGTFAVQESNTIPGQIRHKQLQHGSCPLSAS